MKKLFILFLICMSYQFIMAQQNATTDNGKKVILNTDGTWKYADSNNSSTSNNGTSATNNNSGKTPDCEEYEFGTILITNNRDETIRVFIGNLKQLINNPEYGNTYGKNVPKKIWKTIYADIAVPAGETRKANKVMAGSYSYYVKDIYNTGNYGSGDVEVQQCLEETIEVN